MNASLLGYFLLQAAPARGTNPIVPLLIQMGAIFAIFYFLMIRPQQKQRRQHEERLRNLRKGDSVVTAGGLVGEVVHIRESAADDAKGKTMEDHVTIKTGEARVVVERGRIARVAGASGTSEPPSR
ncbi:MAG: preprotein translocase subunit YajC [Gemmatimonadaceae bacterium]|nr:preprotein translocase subunit YajC [Gemmatimonadaceae bacterium]